MFSRDAVLFANEAFYQAFAGADLAAMDALWAHEMPVTCIHPGWHVLNSRDRIMEAWEQVFSHDNQAPLVCRAPEAFVVGDVAFVICYEQLPDAVLIATNIFCRENRQWRMVHHQSGPTPGHPSQLRGAPASLMRAH